MMAKSCKTTTIKKYRKSAMIWVNLTMIKIQMNQTSPTELNTGHLLNSKTMPDTTENGFQGKISELEKENKFGQMVRCMKGGGRITKPMVWEDLSMLMVMFMMEIGLMIRHTDLGCTVILMEQSTRANGKKTNNMAMVLKHGQMVQDMKENMFKERNTEKANLLGLMEALSLDNLLITILKDKVNTTGLTEENSMDHGKTIKWKEVESSPGLMAEDTKEIT